MWLEILKIFLSSAITTIILGYFFNKKLERHKMFLKVNEQYLSSLITGLNKFMGDFKTVIIKAEEIEHKLKNDSVTKETFEELRKVSRDFSETVSGHRIYLMPFIPFGASNEEVGLHQLAALQLGLLNLMNENLKDSRAETKELCFRVINTLKEKYDLATGKANQMTKGVYDGVSPFDTNIYNAELTNK